MKWEDLHPEMRRIAPGCPDILLDEAIRDAAIEFFMKTDAYKTEETVFLVKGVDEYSLSAPRGFEVNHILQLMIGTEELSADSFEGVRATQSSGQDGKPRFYGSPDNTFFYIAPIPEQSYSMKAIYSLKPLRSSSAIPDSIGLEYKDAIVAGALNRVLVQANVPWADTDRAIYFERKFMKETARVQRVVKFGFGGASLRANYRPFGY